jgi:hypothetical protein
MLLNVSIASSGAILNLQQILLLSGVDLQISVGLGYLSENVAEVFLYYEHEVQNLILAAKAIVDTLC